MTHSSRFALPRIQAMIKQTTAIDAPIAINVPATYLTVESLLITLK